MAKGSAYILVIMREMTDIEKKVTETIISWEDLASYNELVTVIADLIANMLDEQAISIHNQYLIK